MAEMSPVERYVEEYGLSRKENLYGISKIEEIAS